MVRIIQIEAFQALTRYAQLPASPPLKRLQHLKPSPVFALWKTHPPRELPIWKNTICII